MFNFKDLLCKQQNLIKPKHGQKNIVYRPPHTIETGGMSEGDF